MENTAFKVNQLIKTKHWVCWWSNTIECIIDSHSHDKVCNIYIKKGCLTVLPLDIRANMSLCVPKSNSFVITKLRWNVGSVKRFHLASWSACSSYRQCIERIKVWLQCPTNISDEDREFKTLLNFSNTTIRRCEPGPWFNIKMSSYQYRKYHWGDKTVVRSPYLHNGISYTGNMSSLHWIGTQNDKTLHIFGYGIAK